VVKVLRTSTGEFFTKRKEDLGAVGTFDTKLIAASMPKMKSLRLRSSYTPSLRPAGSFICWQAPPFAGGHFREKIPGKKTDKLLEEYIVESLMTPTKP